MVMAANNVNPLNMSLNCTVKMANLTSIYHTHTSFTEHLLCARPNASPGTAAVNKTDEIP